MFREENTRAMTEPDVNPKPRIGSYDLGQEHSLEHAIEVQHAVEQAAKSLEQSPPWMAKTSVA